MEMMQDNLRVERTLSVFDKKTAEIVTEYLLINFDLDDFRQQFKVEDNDPMMYDVYPITFENVEFVKHYLSEVIAFDFESNNYYVEASSLPP